MNRGIPLLPWWSPLVGTIRLVSLLSALSAGCAHTVVDEDMLRPSNDNNVIHEAAIKAPICEDAAGPSSADGTCPEMGLPRHVSSPLECTHPKISPAGHALCLQCAVQPGVRADSVLLRYRKPSEEPFHSLAMQRSPNGLFTVTVPAAVMSGYGLLVYYEALDGIDRVAATDGERDSPFVIRICEGRK